MSTYAIDQWGFIRWEGPPPGLSQQSVTTYSKMGADGITAQKLGYRGEPFQIQLTAWYANQNAARYAQTNYRHKIGDVANVIYEGTLYTYAYSHKYLVQHCMVERVKIRPRLIAPGIDYLGGWEVVSNWTLIPWHFISQSLRPQR